MARSYPMAATIDGQQIGFNLRKPADEPTYAVFYRNPEGRRQKRDTKQTSFERAKEAALAILHEVHGLQEQRQEIVSWVEAVTRMQAKALADGRRGPTIDYYCKLIRRMRGFYPQTAGPAEVTEAMAQQWKQTFSSTPTRRRKLPSQHTVVSLIGGFSALWQCWFVEELGICPVNPWREIDPPKTDVLEVKIIDEETLTDFLAWLDQRFDGWEMPRLFIETKAVTGCRLMDLCSLESEQLRDGRLHFRPEQTKGRKARSVLLPAEVFARLEALKGPRYLWQTYPVGLVAAIKKMGCPVHRVKPDFVPRRLYHWIESLFLDYGRAHPTRPKIHSHQLRKRAFTAAWQNGVDPRKAAIAYGCNVDTVMKHYVVMDEQATTDEVTLQLATALAPKAKGSAAGVAKNT